MRMATVVAPKPRLAMWTQVVGHQSNVGGAACPQRVVDWPHASAQRVLVHIHQEVSPVSLCINQAIVVATAKDGAVPPVDAVQPAGKLRAQVAHSPRQLARQRLEQQVVVVGHERIAVQADAKARQILKNR